MVIGRGVESLKRRVLGLIVVVAASSLMAADFNWTGGAGDHLWSSAGNWAKEDGTPCETGPEEGGVYTYKFENFEDGLVVIQDIDVAASIIEIGKDGDTTTRNTVTWCTAEGKTFKFSDKRQIFVKGHYRLILNCDMSSHPNGEHITKITSGILAFKLKAANQGECQLVLDHTWDKNNSINNINNTVEFLEGGVTPNIRIRFQGDLGCAVKNNEADTLIGDLTCNETALAFNVYNRVQTFGHSLTVGSLGDATDKSMLHFPVFATGGSLVLQAERVFGLRDLPIGGTLKLKRADCEIESIDRFHTLYWNFDDPADPRKDLLGYGSRMLMPKGELAVVNDPERGNVIKFEGGKCFMGPDAEGGLEGLCLDETKNPVTVSFWIKPDGNCDKKAKLFFWGLGDDGKAVALRFNDAEGKPLMFTNWRNNKEIESSVNLFDGNWHHILVSNNRDGRFFVYLDGVCISDSRYDNFSHVNKNFYIGSVWGGGWTSGGENPYTGLMDDFYVGSYYSNEEEVARLYNQGTDSMIGAANVAIEDSGTLALSDRDWTVGALSGEGLQGGVEMRGDGDKKLAIGVDATGRSEYKALLRGANVTLEKFGAGYKQIMSGKAENVTNLVIREGELELRRPLMRQGQAVHYGFDSAEELLRDDGVANLTLSPDGEAAPLYIADGVRGGAIRFADGAAANSGMAIPPSNFPVGNSSFTVSVWIRPTAEACANESAFVCWGGTDDYKFVYLRFVSSTVLRFSNWSCDMDATGFGNLDDGKWHHIVATYDAENYRLKSVYVDGLRRSTQNAAHDLNVEYDKPLRLALKWDNSLQYSGDMDELTICNYAWSQEEVTAEYQLKNPQTETNPAAFLPQPIAHWTFDDGENIGADSSRNGFDLTVAGNVNAEEGGLINGKAARISDESGYFKLETVPDVFPQGNKDFTVIYRIKADTWQREDSFPTVLTWGDTDKWASGGLLKLGMKKGRAGVRLTVCGDVWEDKDDFDAVNNIYTSVGTERLRWQTIAVTYRPSHNDAKSVRNVYYDGKLAYMLMNNDKNVTLVPQDFAIGAMANGTGKFRGLIDDVQIYDQALSAGQIRYLSEKLSGVDGFSVLPEGAAVSVADNAKLKVAANERIAALSGSGSVTVAPLATLSVGSTEGFSGTFDGYGTVELRELAVSSLEGLPQRTTCRVSFATNGVKNWNARLQAQNWTALLTAEGGIAGFENLATWRNAPESREIRLRLSADGTTLEARTVSRFMLGIR